MLMPFMHNNHYIVDTFGRRAYSKSHPGLIVMLQAFYTLTYKDSKKNSLHFDNSSLIE